MSTVTVHQAQTQMFNLLAQIRRGDEVILTEDQEPVARLVPFEPAQPRRPGALKGRISLTPAFFEPLSGDEIAAWGGE